ncbi:MAG: hypothetical protein MZV64_35610 [Ignavibacteriales bacterium]|nr:hypothetical protein [Ignavibacteriales bacterium]
MPGQVSTSCASSTVKISALRSPWRHKPPGSLTRWTSPCMHFAAEDGCSILVPGTSGRLGVLDAARVSSHLWFES